jgi:hypothetical protein
MTEPELPYDGGTSSGWAGSATSHVRALTQDTDGTTSARQQATLDRLGRYAGVGLTWKELAAAEGWHHGQASGVLSVLHKTGHIARLTETRDRCAVYVLPRWVAGRETAPHGVVRANVDLDRLDRVRALAREWQAAYPESGMVRRLVAVLEGP